MTRSAEPLREASAEFGQRVDAGTVPLLVQIGSHRHGVTEYAQLLADQVGQLLGRDLSHHQEIGSKVEAVPGAGPVHVHVTDRLFGRGPESAAIWIEELAARRPVTVTLHDLPQRSDGPMLARRTAAYRRIVAAARGTVCNSVHETQLLAEQGTAPTRAFSVIPLPVAAPTVVRPTGDGPEPVAALLGYVYPGKGHAEVLDAVARLNLGGRAGAADAQPPLGVLAIGAMAHGHEPDLATLQQRATTRGTAFSVTGYLSTPEMMDRCRRVAVPIAAHQHVSASGSVNTWLTAGRRPLVPDTRYFREMAELRPGTLHLFRPERLDEALQRCRRQPEITWLGSAGKSGDGPREVAARYLQWWTNEVEW